jgi:hypothetical protein
MVAMNWFKKTLHHLAETARTEERKKRGQVAMPGDQRIRLFPMQRQPYYQIGGHPHVRIAWGDEKDSLAEEGKLCPCCGMKPGDLHIPSCVNEQCPSCGGQAFVCGCDYGN